MAVQVDAMTSATRRQVPVLPLLLQHPVRLLQLLLLLRRLVAMVQL